MALADTDDRAARRPRDYGNWRKPSSSGLFGLGTIGTLLLFIVLAVVATLMIFAPLVGFASLGGVAVVVLLLAVRDRHGKSTVDRGAARAAWWWSRSRGEHLYRSGPLGRTAWGTYQLPGIVARSRLSEQQGDAYGEPFAMLYTPAPQGATYTVVLGSEPDGATLVDPEQIDAWVDDWGTWLANLGDEPEIEAVSVTIETAPDSGERLRREVASTADPGASDFSKEVMAEILETYPAGASSVKAYVALSFSARSEMGRRRSESEVAVDLAARLPGLAADLGATGAGTAHPVTAQELCELVRTAYEPSAAVLVDRAHADGNAPEIHWWDVGPAAHEESWDSYRHDGAVSKSWIMSRAPLGHVQSGVLARLLAPHRDITRKRVTLLYRPIDSATRAMIVEKDRKSARFLATTNTDPTARSQLGATAADVSAQEEAQGAGLVNFGMIVTATVTDSADPTTVDHVVTRLGASARLLLRPAYGAQASAFAAGLPLGLVLPKHLRVPSSMKGKA